MFKVFQKYGNIQEVVIPAKRNKLGRRFGFARFVHVHDEERFGTELDNIIIGRDKIFANLSRFQRRRGDVRDTEVQNHRDRQGNMEKPSYNHINRLSRTDRAKRSFAEV
ncbi:RNA-binding protein 25-like, partial [Trifolium medium]|nr:RNA-binding protein 25-like [Trifolium medium]